MSTLIYTVIAVSFAGLYLGNNLSHWYFCHKYHKIGQVMSYMTKGKRVPRELRGKHQQVNNTFVALNSIVSVLAGITYWL